MTSIAPKFRSMWKEAVCFFEGVWSKKPETRTCRDKPDQHCKGKNRPGQLYYVIREVFILFSVEKPRKEREREREIHNIKVNFIKYSNQKQNWLMSLIGRLSRNLRQCSRQGGVGRNRAGKKYKRDWLYIKWGWSVHFFLVDPCTWSLQPVLSSYWTLS